MALCGATQGGEEERAAAKKITFSSTFLGLENTV
jgi:hypothetical protein